MVACRLEQLEGRVQGMLVTGPNAGGTGVIVLGGSSGRIDTGRAELFAKAGATALALQWFGGDAQSPGICEIPLETFLRAVDFLISDGCRRVVLVGTSKGAEAALLIATLDPRVDAVVAISPTSVVWGNIGPGLDGASWPERSSWSLAGKPLNFVPTDPDWQRERREGFVSYRSLFERCLAADQEVTNRARIPVETAPADIVLVAGGDDALWPSDVFADDLARRRQKGGKPVSLILDRQAGHRVLLPGETTPRSRLHAHGGGDEADARLGRAAWERIVTLL